MIIDVKSKEEALRLAARLRSEGRKAVTMYRGRFDRSRGVLVNVSFFVKVKS